MTHVTITILAQMSCPVPVVKVVVGSIPGSVGFLVLFGYPGVVLYSTHSTQVA
jgi:hypothetical protein